VHRGLYGLLGGQPQGADLGLRARLDRRHLAERGGAERGDVLEGTQAAGNRNASGTIEYIHQPSCSSLMAGIMTSAGRRMLPPYLTNARP